jgi:hypothetical protein
MRRASTILIVLIVVLTLAGGAQAGAPRSVQFVLTGHTDPNSLNNITIRPHFVKIIGLKTAGVVTGDLAGTFSYTENIGEATDLNKAVTVGNMTIVVGGDANDTVKVRFFGVDQVIPQPPPAFPQIVVVDQPWVITAGTGKYKGIQGAGTRSTFTDGCGDEFCVKYKGKIF